MVSFEFYFVDIGSFLLFKWAEQFQFSFELSFSPPPEVVWRSTQGHGGRICPYLMWGRPTQGGGRGERDPRVGANVTPPRCAWQAQ